MPFRYYDYLPILLIFIVAAGFAVGNIFISQFIGQRKRTRTKMMPYECGKDPVGDARQRFSVKFYLIAMIFILFDIEVIFLIPWAVVFKTLSAPATGLATLIYVEMLIFIVLLLAGYVYVIKKGAFEWNERARLEAEAEAPREDDGAVVAEGQLAVHVLNFERCDPPFVGGRCVFDRELHLRVLRTPERRQNPPCAI